MLESDLEKALVAQIEKFLLELGRGFMFAVTQQHITLLIYPAILSQYPCLGIQNHIKKFAALAKKHSPIPGECLIKTSLFYCLIYEPAIHRTLH